MADEATDALIPEAPSTEAAAPTEAPAPDPFEKRYNDLRSEFDRKNALLDRATKQGDIEAIRALGFDYEEPEDPTPEYVEEDPYAAEFAQTKKELDELKQWRQAQEAERVASGIRSHVQSLAQEAGLELSDYDKEVIFRGAVGGDKIDAEVTAAAFKAHADYIKGLQEQYSDKPHVPRPGTGQAVEKQPDLDDPQERKAWMKAQLGLS
jgi:hypothetical protein